MGAYATTLLGPPPDPRSAAFLQYWDDLLALRLSRVPLARATTYHFSELGNDSTGDGTPSKPFKTRAKAITLTASNTRLRFRRGETFTEATGDWNITVPHVTVDSYGPDWLPNPLFNAFTRQYPAGGGGWTLVSGTTYYRAEANDIAWVRRVLDRRTLLVPARAASSVLAASAWGQFYYDSGAQRLYVNFNADPNTIDLEAIVSNAYDGVTPWADDVRVQGIDFHGWGCHRTNTATQKQGVTSRVAGTDEALIVDCGAYFSGSHTLAFYGGPVDASSSGGITTFVNCRTGYGKWNGGAGQTLLNSYSHGGQETVFFDCAVTHGVLPSADWDYASDGRCPQTEAYFGHCGVDPAALLAVVRTRISTPDNGYGLEFDGHWYEDNLPAAATPDQARGFSIGTHADDLRYMEIGWRNQVRVNSYLRAVLRSGQQGNIGISQGGWSYNCVYELDARLAPAGSSIGIAVSAVQTYTMANSMIRVLLDDADGAKLIDVNLFGDSSFNVGAFLFNSIIQVEGSPYANMHFLNNSANLKSNAYFNIQNETVGSIGYNQDAGRVNLTGPVGVLADMVAAGQIDGHGDAALAPAYDYFGVPRGGGAVSIGPVQGGSVDAASVPVVRRQFAPRRWR